MALDSFLIQRLTRSSPASRVRHSCSLIEIDRQQAVFQIRAHHLHSVRQHKRALELTCGNAAMEVLAGLVVLLSPADHQLAFLDADIEVIPGETRNGERDTQPLRVLPVARQTLDVVGRVTVSPLGDAVEHALDLIETQEERAGEGWNSRHWSQSPRLKRL